MSISSQNIGKGRDRDYKPVKTNGSFEPVLDVHGHNTPQPTGPVIPNTPVTLDLLLEVTPTDYHELVQKAYEFGERLHTGQKRISGDPYIQHPLTVAYYLGMLRLDGPTIAAGLLHDTLEDTEISFQELSSHFPDPVPQIVQGVTKISKMNFQTNHDAQVENLRIMFLAMAKDIRVVIVKLCDRLHNMQTLKHLNAEKRKKISQETLDIYAPLANRLGIQRIRSEMEDLAMRWIYPEAYQELSKFIATKRGEREQVVNDSVDYLYEKLRPTYPNIEVYGRPKHFYSIFRKMQEQELSFDQIYDLNALRIICDDEKQCYEVMGRVHAIWSPMPGRFKDYIGQPKKNLYQSIHTTVIGLNGTVSEIQIRTRDMHQVAEFGIAAHWKYKETGSEIQNDDRLAWLRQLAEWITDPKDSENLLEALKKDVFADRVLCYTPKGDVVELPADATPIDFAYQIHTEVGEHCVGAKINGTMVNLRTKLHNGDIVQIQTAPNGHPSRDWLDYIVTGRARSKIKHWLKARNVDEWVEAGRRALQRIFDERKIKVTHSELESELENLLQAYKLHTIEDILVEIGFGSISPQAAIARMKKEWTIKPEPKRTPKKKKREEKARKSSELIIVQGAEGAPKKVANCCSPIPGDLIVAYVTRGRGITIHQDQCKNISRIRKDPEEAARVLPAKWNRLESTLHSVSIRVESEDRSGLLARISSIISDKHIFIKTCMTKSDVTRGVATLQFDVDVSDVEQLESVITSIRHESGVIKAERKRSSQANSS